MKNIEVRKIPYGRLINTDVYFVNGVNTMRKKGYKHFGNPFTATPHVANKNKSLILMETIPEAVNAYYKWLEDTLELSSFISDATILKLREMQRKWILEQINDNSSHLNMSIQKGLPFWYMETKNDYYSHANALIAFINQIKKQ